MSWKSSAATEPSGSKSRLSARQSPWTIVVGSVARSSTRPGMASLQRGPMAAMASGMLSSRSSFAQPSANTVGSTAL
jgi:hypothetical protein